MNFTTASSITVDHERPLTDATAYAANQLTLLVVTSENTTRYVCDSVTPRVVDTTGTILSFAGVSLPADGLYVLKVVQENSADSDQDGVVVNTLSTGTVRKVTSSAAVAI